jgi:hypothetical protein
MSSLGGVGNIDNIQSIIDKYKLNLKESEVKVLEKDRLLNSRMDENEDYVISPEKENALFLFKSMSVFEDSVFSEFRDIEGDEFVKVKKSLKITFEEIWKKNQTLPPAKEKDEFVKNEFALGEFVAEKAASDISGFVKDLFNYVKHNEMEKNSRDISENEFRVWALENIAKGYENTSSKLSGLYSSDENISRIVDLAFESSFKKIESYFSGIGDSSQDKVEGIASKHSIMFEASKEYVGISIV